MSAAPKEFMERFQSLLEEQGLKFTHERRSIFEEVCHVKEHFDADSLYERFKKKGDRISRATVYRTMPLLLEAGAVQKSAGNGKRDYFEKTDDKGHHDHMVCLGCKKIIEFHSDALEELQQKLSVDYRFKLVFHDHRLFGYCEACQPQGAVNG